jgi:hypothetical protein
MPIFYEPPSGYSFEAWDIQVKKNDFMRFIFDPDHPGELDIYGSDKKLIPVRLAQAEQLEKLVKLIFDVRIIRRERKKI